MKTPLAFRWIAYLNLGCGALQLIAAVAMAVELFLVGGSTAKLITGALAALLLIVAAGFVYAAVVHLKDPHRETALALAANTAVIIWFALGGLFRAVGLRTSLGEGYVIVALGIAYLMYQFVLRPAAFRAFPADG